MIWIQLCRRTFQMTIQSSTLGGIRRSKRKPKDSHLDSAKTKEKRDRKNKEDSKTKKSISIKQSMTMQKISKKNYIANKFKKYHNPNTKKDTKKELQETLSPGSIKLKNTHIINKIKDVLSNREDPSEQDLLDEFSNMEDEEDYYNNVA